jgi:phenylacetate-coenzyme A ligase PaaK-like adenylate-forming protein
LRDTSIINEKVDLFLNKWENSNLPSKELVFEYILIAKDLMFAKVDLIKRTTSLMSQNIKKWALKNSPVYRQDKEYFSKVDLEDKSIWYVDEIKKESQPMATSGSTSGNQFGYLRWDRFLRQIEGENHYDLILEEFEIKNPKVANMFTTSLTKENFVYEIKSENFMQHHGFHFNAKVYVVYKTKTYYENQDKYFNEVIQYFEENPVDVILTCGPMVNSLVHHIKRRGNCKKITNLLSNTCEYMFKEDANYLKENKIISHWCDHMRCWDGGASFFTCKHGIYHLMDNLSFCEEIDGKLISTDYFSFTSPFVKYWNGDLCRIKNEYERCMCGRAFRPFLFLENRPFSIKGKCISEFQEKIKKSGIIGIKQMKCSNSHIEVVCKWELNKKEKETIISIMNGFKIDFTIEENYERRC